MNLLKTALALGSVLGAREAVKGLQHVDLDQVLGTVGLERKSASHGQAMPGIGLIAIGAALGAGAALLLAPSSGRELRSRISGRIGDARHQLSEKLREFERDQDRFSTAERS